MPLRLNPLERLLTGLGILPTPLLDTPLAAGIARALICACQLHLFEELVAGPQTPEELALKLGCQREGLALLLALLAPAGYLRYRRGRYENSRLARRWLTGETGPNLTPYLIHTDDILAIWEHWPQLLREGGTPVALPYTTTDASPGETARAAALARHYTGLAALALALGDEIVRRVPLPPQARLLLDVGGSHAAYSVLFCRRYAHLQATIVDTREGIEAGLQTAQREGLTERLHFVCADIVGEDFVALLPERYDVALYFHVAHLLTPALNRALLARVTQALRPGGLLVYLDQVPEGDGRGRSPLAALLVGLMALTMATVGGSCYPFATVRTWLEECGLRSVRRHRLLMPGATLITAHRP
jgi:SAM-dependent methyltransferase